MALPSPLMNTELPPKPLLPPCNGTHATPWGAAGDHIVPEYLFMCRCELFASLPAQYREEAKPARGTEVWVCPWQGCPQTYNFVHVIQWTTSWLAERLQTESANLHPEDIVAWAGVALERIVRRHYPHHLYDEGIEIIEIGNAVSVISVCTSGRGSSHVA